MKKNLFYSEKQQEFTGCFHTAVNKKTGEEYRYTENSSENQSNFSDAVHVAKLNDADLVRHKKHITNPVHGITNLQKRAFQPSRLGG